MKIIDRYLDEAEAYLASKADDFINIRQIGYAKIMDEFGNKFEGLSKNELEERRHEHRLRRQALAKKIENYRINFESEYLIYSICQGVFWFLIPLLAGAILFLNAPKFIVIIITAANIGIIFIMAVLMQWCLKLLIELYEIYGAADALISLADYRCLEQIDLSRLPLTETEADTAEYYF